MSRENWTELYTIGEWDYSWSISKVYMDRTTGDFFVLHDSGCSCNSFDMDTAGESGPFSGAVEVLHAVSGFYGATADGATAADIVALLPVLDRAKSEFWNS